MPNAERGNAELSAFNDYGGTGHWGLTTTYDPRIFPICRGDRAPRLQQIY